MAIWAYVHLKNNKKPTVDALSVLPDSCLVYMRTTDFFELNKKINSQNLLVDKLKLFTEMEAFCNTLQLFDSLLNSNELLHEQIQNNKLHFALYNKNLNWLLSFNIKQLGRQSTIEKKLSELFQAEKNDDETFSFYLNKKLFFKLNEGVVFLSDEPQLLQKAFDTKTKKLFHNKNFIAFKNTLEENTLLNIYVEHKDYAKSQASKKFALSSICKKSISAGNIDFQPSQITVNGFFNADSNEVFFLLKNQVPQNVDFTGVLPMSTISFTAIGFEKIPHSKNKNAKFWQEVNDSAMYNLQKEFYENAVEQFINFETQAKYVAIKIADQEKALEHLQYMSDSVFQGNIFHIKQKLNLFYPLSATITQYAAMLNDYVFFSQSQSDLLILLNELKNGNVMNKNASFVLYKNQHFPEKFNVLIYTAPNLLSKEEIKQVFGFSSKNESNPFENFKHFSFYAINNERNFKFRYNINHEVEVLDKNILWTLNLGNACRMQPYGFINHNTKENELIIQDEANILYLINAKGTILWKKQLNEKITSPIYMVDAVKNKKYQMLFSTKNHIHLIDRNGKYLNNYPSKLPAEATSPLSLLDYDNDKDYRLFIACKNKTIYNYNISGVKQDHFTPVKTDNEVNLPIQYVKVGLSDYLVTIDKEGKVYTFSRRGAGRIGLINKAIKDCKTFFVDATDNINSTYLYYVDDKNALINKISFTDKKEITDLNKNISNAGASFDKVGNNRNTDLIIAANNNLYVYGLNGNVLFEKTTKFETPANIAFYGDITHSLFILHNQEQEKLLVFNQTNQSEKTFEATALPLVSTLFDSKKYLIVVNGNHLTCQVLE